MPPRRKPYRFLPHTADVAVDAAGRTLPSLFEHSALALFDLVTDRATVRPRRRVPIAARGQTREDLLVRFLSEILYLQEVKGWRFRACKVSEVDRFRLVARGSASGEPFDETRHPRRREVKAITYHQIAIRKRAGAWRVRFVLDV
jgi:SHS2 domain-containing protein